MGAPWLLRMGWGRWNRDEEHGNERTDGTEIFPQRRQPAEPSVAWHGKLSQCVEPRPNFVACAMRRAGARNVGRCEKLLCPGAERCRKVNDRLLLAQALSGLATDRRETMGKLPPVGPEALWRSVALRRTQDDPLLLAHSVRHVADILREQGQSTEG